MIDYSLMDLHSKIECFPSMCQMKLLELETGRHNPEHIVNTRIIGTDDFFCQIRALIPQVQDHASISSQYLKFTCGMGGSLARVREEIRLDYPNGRF